MPKTFFQFKSSRYGDSSPLSSGDFLVPMALPETDITGEVIQVCVWGGECVFVCAGAYVCVVHVCE